MAERLADAIHLVVGFRLGKSQQLGFKLRQKKGSLRKEDKTCLELCLLDIEPSNLIAFNRNRLHYVGAGLTQLLSQCDAGGCVFNQDSVRLEALRKCNSGVTQLGYS